MPENVATTLQQRIFTIRIDRPEKKNALTRAMYVDLIGAIQRAEKDANVRVIVLTGGEDCFTAGNDLADFAAAEPGEAPVALEYLRALAAAKKPVIAAVAGVAIGIGTTMLLHCDMVYASETARFQLPFVNLGLPRGGIERDSAHDVGSAPRSRTIAARRAVWRRSRAAPWSGQPLCGAA